jgi:alpha-beta hydrolase superfamily lysophospholipase
VSCPPANMGGPRRYSLGATGVALACYEWLPVGRPVGVVQIAHGRGEHALRYSAFANDCRAAGLAVYANDHRGHGATAQPGQLGSFGAAGFGALVDDMAALTLSVRSINPGTPVILLGHSMGSFAAQMFVGRHARLLSGLVLSGSAALDLRYAGSSGPTDYNARCKPERTPFDWLSRDESAVDAYIADPLCGFPLDSASQQSMVASAPRMLPPVLDRLPVLLLTGDQDPVNGNLLWFHPLVERYRTAGAAVTVQSYEGGRHEMLNEINRAEVKAALIDWIKSACASVSY